MENETAQSGKKATKNMGEGLPDIAQKREKNPLLLVLLAVIVVIFVIIAFINYPKDKKTEQAVEENYSIEGNNSANGKNVPRSPIQIPTNRGGLPQIDEQQLVMLAARQKALQQRLNAPLMAYKGDSKASTNATPANGVNTGDANTQFMNQVASRPTDTVRATLISPKYLIAEGSIIHAVLETAINSDLPGNVRAVVDSPVYSEDGSRLLVPPGSRLVGQYKSGMQQGQSRVFIVWTRLIVPGGISINLGSAGIDSLGMAGMQASEIDHHFWQQFGMAILLSVIGAGTANVGVTSSDQNNAAQAYRSGVANSFSQTANQSLQQQGAIPPTIWIHQGRPIMVFVAHDLDFQGAMHEMKNGLEIF